MTTARYLVGDVFERMAELEGPYDLVITSPPFSNLRSYLPDDHPDKHKEIGSEPTPAAYLDVMLALTAEWGRLLSPWGSLAIELGDTYSGSGGAGGDYNDGGIREGQQRFRQGSPSKSRGRGQKLGDDHETGVMRPISGGDGWPLAKSLAMIPELYAASLAYGRNLLTGTESPAGRWRVRNFKPWIRSNPPVGALGDKERPATSYVTVACRATDRYFDLDNVRTPLSENHTRGHSKNRHAAHPGTGWTEDNDRIVQNQAGAPPLDWNVDTDTIINAVIDNMAGKTANRRTAKGVDQQPRSGKSADRDGNWSDLPELAETNGHVGARGHHIRRALTAAGILPPLDALDVSPKGFRGSHYAVWPMELVKLLVQEMVPHRVCLTCGKPSRRITETTNAVGKATGRRAWRENGTDGVGAGHTGEITEKVSSAPTSERVTLGWSDCGHDNYRPGRMLDPFGGSGTTGAVATGMGFDCDLIDLDDRNADLARERIGMFLEVIDRGTPHATDPTSDPQTRGGVRRSA